MSSSQVVAVEVIKDEPSDIFSCFPFRIDISNMHEVEIFFLSTAAMKSPLCNVVLHEIVDSVNELCAEAFKDKHPADVKELKAFFSSSFQNSYNFMLQKHPDFSSMVNDLQQKAIRHIQLKTVVLP